MNQKELEQITQWIKEATTKPNADENIQLILKLASNSITQDKVENLVKPTNPDTKSFITYFTKKEIAKMSKTFKTEFIANGLAALVLKRQRSKNCFIFVVRYRRGEYSICVSANTMEKAKERFIEATTPQNIDQYRVKKKAGEQHSFEKITREWLASKDGTIDSRTLRDYVMNCETRIIPILGERKISTITTNDLKQIIDSHQGRVIETLQTILKGIMSYAIANGEILYNPMQAIKFRKAKRENRRALTIEEQATFHERVSLPEFAPYRKLLLLQYDFGLRPVEFTDARFDGNFLIALNAKHKTSDGDKVYKKIPIPKQARIHIDITEPIECPFALDTLNRIFKKVLQDSTVTQYYLRHTYATTCIQYVRPDIVDTWMGDSSERLVGRVYTHFPDKFMTAQMDLVQFEF